MKRSAIASLALILIAIPATLFLGTQLSGRAYYLTSTLIILETMFPFFLAFETRKPQARELVTLAVLSALATVSRIAIPLPNFKPTTAIIMLTGIALGPETGFVSGAVTAFASNFFYSQGPWTPWQMLSYGFGGYLAGILFFRRKRPGPILLCAFGFVSVLLIVGPLLDASTIFTTGSRISMKFILAVLAAGLPHNLKHALSCAATLLLFSKPLLGKLDRLKSKYGMMDVN